MNYIITHNLIEERPSRERTAAEKEQFPFYFELYDDDHELYARGYSNDESTEKLFDPLNDWMIEYGCVGIKYINKTTNKMEWQ